MVDKKKGKSKSKKKKPVISQKDKKIKELQKKLKEMAKKYLRDRKKKSKPLEYAKEAQRVATQMRDARTSTDIEKLISLLSSKQSQSSPTTTGTINERITRATALPTTGSSGDPFTNWRNLKMNWNDLKTKYDNDTLTLTDITRLYATAKLFGKSINENLPSREQLETMYGDAKRLYRYITRFMNRNRPDGEDFSNLQQPPQNQPTSTPTPTPPTPTPPPAPAPAPAPEPQPEPQPDPQPEQTGTQWLLSNMPNPVNTALGVGLLAGGGILGRNLMGMMRGRPMVGQERVLARGGPNQEQQMRNIAEGIGAIRNLAVVAQREPPQQDRQFNLDRVRQNLEALRERRDNQLDRFTNIVRNTQRDNLRERQVRDRTRQEYGQNERLHEEEQGALGGVDPVRPALQRRPRVGAREMAGIREGEEFVDRGTPEAQRELAQRIMEETQPIDEPQELVDDLE